ncbi:anti-sigma factor [Yoonia sp. 208BN28-4]|uniref:anti-sigma factor n=1 Tax=Yoonia sp. 208BN28-4 TaxID=3126505 RepID=UPI0030B20A6B
MTDETATSETAPLAAEYTLGLLPEDEARAFEALMSRDPDARAEYAFWAENYAALTNDIPHEAPPAHVWTGISDVAFGPAAPRASWFSRFGLPSALGGGLLAALAVLWLVDLSGMMGGETSTYTAQIAAEDSSLIIQASFDDSTDTLSLTRDAGAAADGRDLELWLISGGNAPVSLGVIPETQTADIQLDADVVAALQDGVLAISDEPEGGSPTGAPTGAVLAVGPLIAL